MKITVSLFIGFFLSSLIHANSDNEMDQTKPETIEEVIRRVEKERAEAAKPPESISRILASRLTLGWIFDMSGLDPVKAEKWKAELTASHEDFESHSLRSSAIADAYEHTIHYNKKTREYWVVRTGGIAGVFEVFGPGRLDEIQEKQTG